MSKIEAINQGFWETDQKSKIIGLSGVLLIAVGIMGYFQPINSYIQAICFICGSYFSAYHVQEVLSNAIAYNMLMEAKE